MPLAAGRWPPIPRRRSPRPALLLSIAPARVLSIAPANGAAGLPHAPDPRPAGRDVRYMTISTGSRATTQRHVAQRLALSRQEVIKRPLGPRMTRIRSPPWPSPVLEANQAPDMYMWRPRAASPASDAAPRSSPCHRRTPRAKRRAPGPPNAADGGQTSAHRLVGQVPPPGGHHGTGPAMKRERGRACAAVPAPAQTPRLAPLNPPRATPR